MMLSGVALFLLGEFYRFIMVPLKKKRKFGSTITGVDSPTFSSIENMAPLIAKNTVVTTYYGASRAHILSELFK